MAKPIGYYTGYNPKTKKPAVLHNIQERFGSQLEEMTYEQKIVMRTALSFFISQAPVWQGDALQNCDDTCVEIAGCDWDIEKADSELVVFIQQCFELDESNIEGLIEALTAQIRGEVYASRLDAA